MNSRLDQFCDLVALPSTTVDEVQRFINEAPFDLNDRHSIHDSRPVAFAAQSGNPEVLRFLIKNCGANLATPFTITGWTNLLMWACENPDRRVLSYLTDPETKLWQQFNDGTTDLMAQVIACQIGILELSELQKNLSDHPEGLLDVNLQGFDAWDFCVLTSAYSSTSVVKIRETFLEATKQWLATISDTTPYSQALALQLKTIGEPISEKNLILKEISLHKTQSALKEAVVEGDPKKISTLKKLLLDRFCLLFSSHEAFLKDHDHELLSEHFLQLLQELSTQYEFIFAKDEMHYSAPISFIILRQQIRCAHWLAELYSNQVKESSDTSEKFILNKKILSLQNKIGGWGQLLNDSSYKNRLLNECQRQKDVNLKMQERLEGQLMLTNDFASEVEIRQKRIQALENTPIENRSVEDNANLQREINELVVVYHDEGFQLYTDGKVLLKDDKIKPLQAIDLFQKGMQPVWQALQLLNKLPADYPHMKAHLCMLVLLLQNLSTQLGWAHRTIAQDAMQNPEMPLWQLGYQHYAKAEKCFENSVDCVRTRLEIGDVAESREECEELIDEFSQAQLQAKDGQEFIKTASCSDESEFGTIDSLSSPSSGSSSSSSSTHFSYHSFPNPRNLCNHLNWSIKTPPQATNPSRLFTPMELCSPGSSDKTDENSLGIALR